MFSRKKKRKVKILKRKTKKLKRGVRTRRIKLLMKCQKILANLPVIVRLVIKEALLVGMYDCYVVLFLA